jgi:dolichyl-phosphate-mannose--protein O-mannosyl transferase
VLAILVSVFFYPVWTGLQIPDWYFNLTHWLPGWY